MIDHDDPDKVLATILAAGNATARDRTVTQAATIARTRRNWPTTRRI